MSEICNVCGLPKPELCACEEQALASQVNINVRTEKRRYGKDMTIVEGIDANKVDLDELSTALKRICAGGGTVKKGIIEIQGSHLAKVKKELKNRGFPIAE